MHLDEGVLIAKKGSLTFLAYPISGIGWLELYQNHLDPAVKSFKECFRLASQKKDTISVFGLSASLDGFAEIAMRNNQPESAVRLLSAAGNLREKFYLAIFPFPLDNHENNIADARAALGEAAFDTAWAEGRALILPPFDSAQGDSGPALERAIEYALRKETDVEN